MSTPGKLGQSMEVQVYKKFIADTRIFFSTNLKLIKKVNEMPSEMNYAGNKIPISIYVRGVIFVLKMNLP